MSHLKIVTDATWQAEVEQAAGPVLVDFWAPWCAPCKAMLPSITELADEYAGEASVMKLNVDDNPETARRMNVRGIPLLVMFKNGIEVGRAQGGNKSSVAALIDKHLA